MKNELNLEERILKILSQPKAPPPDLPELARRLGIRGGQMAPLEQVLQRLERSGRVARIRNSRFVLPQGADLVAGRIAMSRSGSGLLQPDDSGRARVFVPAEATGTALHQDRVLVRLDTRGGSRRGKRQDEERGKVIRILERMRTRVVGTLQRSRQFYYVIPDDPRIPHDIYVTKAGNRIRAKVGDKVVTELEEWISRHNPPEGRLLEVLGRGDDPRIEVEAVIRQYDLPGPFPAAVTKEAAGLPSTVSAADLQGRQDCRSHLVITIDPDDAKDFDDAICLQKEGKDRWRLWVHIADVSHYVRPGTALDQEARLRGNSTYLVDRVIPMLPEALSNELCSLKPDVDRLTKCAEFLLSAEGRVLQFRTYGAVIHSRRRFTYEEAGRILKGKAGSDVERMLHHADQLAQRLRKLRFGAGALDLDMPEVKLRLDNHARLVKVEKVHHDASHQLIEEFMLLANEHVARELQRKRLPVVYRVHEQPDPDRLLELQEELGAHGIRVGRLDNVREVQKLLVKLNAHPAGDALKIALLRSLRRARYAVDSMGHYGLAKQHYTHFTSPIRRYADLLVHRALFGKNRVSPQQVAQIADHISLTERSSSDAEQDSKTIKLLGYLQGQLDRGQPERYPALVTDIHNFGFVVEVTPLCFSGMVRVSTLNDDFYEFEPGRMRLRGRRTRKIIAVGDRIKVSVAAVDRFKRRADFRLISS